MAYMAYTTYTTNTTYTTYTTYMNELTTRPVQQQAYLLAGLSTSRPIY